MRKLLLTGLVLSSLTIFTAPAQAEQYDISPSTRRVIFNRACNVYRTTDITSTELNEAIAATVDRNTPAAYKYVRSGGFYDGFIESTYELYAISRRQKIINTTYSIANEVYKKCR